MLGARLLAWFLGLCLLNGSGGWYMRVIGASDSPEAQAEKLRVRDAALAACPGSTLALPFALPEIQRAGETVAPCRVEIRLWSPAPDAPLCPTLYITVGAGQGHNWWGVLYPGALRMAAAEPTDRDMDGEGEVEFFWPLWNWLKRLLGL